jgi:hypothetical protein
MSLSIPQQRELIRQALLSDWDPIGVSHVPEAQDEYDGYVTDIHGLLIRRSPVTEIFDYLWWLETERMGLTGDRQATLEFAAKLVRLSDVFEHQ